MKKINEDVQGNLNRDTTQFIKVKKRGQKMTKKEERMSLFQVMHKVSQATC